jgi:hypothetical protein
VEPSKFVATNPKPIANLSNNKKKIQIKTPLIHCATKPRQQVYRVKAWLGGSKVAFESP